MRKLFLVGILLASALLLPACGSGSSGGGREIPVSMAEWSITPNSVEVTAGESITLVVTNKGTQPHDLGLEGTKTASQLLQPGQTAKVTFKAPAAGSYNLICTVAGHKESGMVAKLVSK